MVLCGVPSVSRETIQSALPHVLSSTHLEALGARYEGKVRDNYTTQDGHRIIVVTDRISAFDRIIGTLPLKGQLLTTCAHWWFERTRDVAPNHLLSVPDPNVMIVRECRTLPVEMVVRAYLTGTTSTSIWVHYERGERVFCGHKLPNGMRKHERLPKPLLTPSTKANDGAHDVSASRDQILAATKMNADDFDAAAEMAMALFRRGQQLCADRGLILVDTKYEFGKSPEGDLVVIDEIHTPDSSRFWFSDTYDDRFASGLDPESFDKEYVRRWLASRGFRGDGPTPILPDEVRVEATYRYVEAIERIMGEDFHPHLAAEPEGRICRNLGL
jgi:phosphoribosylaminoimidazole-succinocarboxamide synthase